MAEWYDYKTVESVGGCISPGQDYMIQRDDGFLRVHTLDTETPPTGWKLHVSVDREDVEKAWNLLTPYLVRQGVESFKVATPAQAASFSSSASPQAGKMLTIALHEGDKSGCAIARSVDRILKGAGIRPGLKVVDDKPVLGSRYLSYRNDRDEGGAYISSRRAKEVARQEWQEAFNPYGKADPLDGFAVTEKESPVFMAENREVPLPVVLSAYAGGSVMGAQAAFGDVMDCATFVLGDKVDGVGLKVVQESLEEQFPQLGDLKQQGLKGWLDLHGLSRDDTVTIFQLTPETVRLRREAVIKNEQEKQMVAAVSTKLKQGHKL